MAEYERLKHTIKRSAGVFKRPARENLMRLRRRIKRALIWIRDKSERIPAHRLIPLSFALIIAVGTVLLLLPISTARGQESTGFINALFTATSATCVTGLSPYDTYTHFSTFGQIVILLLIQVGALGVMTLVTSFAMTLRHRLGFRDLRIAQESTGYVNMGGVTGLLKTVLTVTLCCEGSGALLLSFRFIPKYGFLRGIYSSIFVSISAYCNAGFDVMGPNMPSMSGFATDPLVNFTLCALIISGGIGFIVFYDVYSALKQKKRFRELMMHTKIVLITSALLLVAGTVFFLLSEYDVTLKGLSFGDKLLVSFFQSTCARSAGFFSIDLGATRSYTRVLLIILMFVGASPGSTGGGIKTTTLVVLLSTIVCTLRGYQNPVINRRRVTQSTVYKALAITAVAAGVVIVTAIVIVITLRQGRVAFLDALFEATSAFGTCGTTTGVTAKLTTAAKLFVVLAMFIGRVGPISLSLAISTKNSARSETEILPEARILAG